MISMTTKLVNDLAGHSDYFLWTLALHVRDMAEAAQLSGGPAARKAVIADAAAQAGVVPTTMRDRVRAVSWLAEHELDVILNERRLPIGTVTAVVKRAGVDDVHKVTVLTALHSEACMNPGRPVSREEVFARLAAADPAAPTATRSWLRHSDLWHFPRHDPRFGAQGQRDRLPGQAVQNLLHRFLPDGGRLLAAMCGSGTALDVAAITPNVESVGFDLRRHPRVAEHHAERFTVFDATNANWSSVVPDEWADLVLVTPPHHYFGRQSDVIGPTDMRGLYDVDEYVAALRPILIGATRSACVGGVVVVAMKNTSEFENGTPVPNLVHAVTQLAEEHVGFFLAQPVVRVGSRRSRAHDGPWLAPEVVHLITYRKT